MTPEVFPIAAASAAVTALLGSNPTKFWPFARAPHAKTEAIAAAPYALWQVVYGNPENTLGCAPITDLYGVQIDAYASTVTEARQVAAALRDAFEAAQNHVVAFNGEFKDDPTGLYRVSFTADFWTDRSGS
jgi:hypothetical protein